MTSGTGRVGVFALVCAAVVAGCASQTSQQEAQRAATRFLDAVGGGDTETACALLTPRTRTELVTSDGPCGQSLPTDELGGTVLHADTWSDWAQVSTDDGTLFLTEFESGWLVEAAGCRPNGDAPYHCVVGG
jgi:hypothetical protein